MKTPYYLTTGATKGNAFSRHYRINEPSIFASDQAFLENASARASKTREASEAKGINVAQIPGMGSEAFQQNKRADFHVRPTKSLDCRGRAVVDMAPRTIGAITVTKSSEAQRIKSNWIKKASV